MKLRIGFYVSGRATRLRKLLRAWRRLNGESLSQIAMVLIDHDENADLRDLCSQLSILCFEKPLQSFSRPERNRIISDYFFEKLEETGVDWAMIFCDRILIGPILRKFENRIINFHPSLLPEFPGLLSIDQALRAGAREIGNTAHFVDAGVDTGPILLQSRIRRESYQGYDDVLDLQIPMLMQILTWLRDGRITVTGKDARVLNPLPDGKYSPGIEIDEEFVLREIRQ